MPAQFWHQWHQRRVGSKSSWDTAVLHRGIMLGQKRLPVTFHLPHGDPLLTNPTLPWSSSLFPVDILCHLTFFFFFFFPPLPFSFCPERQCVRGLDVGQSRGKGHFQDPHPRSFPTCVRPTARDSFTLHISPGRENCLMLKVGGWEKPGDRSGSWELMGQGNWALPMFQKHQIFSNWVFALTCHLEWPLRPLHPLVVPERLEGRWRSERRLEVVVKFRHCLVFSSAWLQLALQL